MDAYIIGLWLGDKYWWSSSIGLSNSNPKLIVAFRKFFNDRKFEPKRVKLSVYTIDGKEEKKLSKRLSRKFFVPAKNIKFYKLSKNAGVNFILYVNSRALVREFFEMENNFQNKINRNNFVKYFAGRFDADGNFTKSKRMIRIAYTHNGEAVGDGKLLERFTHMKPTIRFYRSNEWILEICGYKWMRFIKSMFKFSKRGYLS